MQLLQLMHPAPARSVHWVYDDPSGAFDTARPQQLRTEKPKRGTVIRLPLRPATPATPKAA